jgi:hypothetical protein
MTQQQAEKLLRKIQDLAEQGDDGEDAVAALNEIRERIEEHRCFCGRDWVRGGRRQGSSLCEECFHDVEVGRGDAKPD